jgi:hypothetical protein
MLSRNVSLEHGMKGFVNGITVRQLLALPYQFGICDHQVLFMGPNGAKIPHFPTDCSPVAAVWMGMSPTFASQP